MGPGPDKASGHIASNRGSDKCFRLAINGYGRIGQGVLRALYENGYRQDFAVVAINELSDLETIAHLTRYDTTHGRFPGEVAARDGALWVQGDRIAVSSEPDVGKLPWQGLDIDLVLECTGAFSDRETAELHLRQGAARVLFSQPAEADVDRTVVMGVNEASLLGSDRIVSAASCTTNCIVPVIDCLHRAFGVREAALTTIHAAMNDQPVIDAYHNRDLRRTRSALANIVPVETGLARGIDRVLPELTGRFSAVAMRVPTINVSAIDMTANLGSDVTVDRVNAVLRDIAAGPLHHIMGYTDELLASRDFNHDSRSVIVDGGQTRVSGKRMVKVLCWFDNEWGFANRMLDLSRYWLTGKGY
ncbi:type I glyceraldehyde-3-phosphate dehydrogenase [Hydrocarboniclastica marina]|uniref:Erythrose-4-phosphate dehydrogenase n=1 Tax=Hydrocarboniclastica marina TaxID=2259620 RepID=A0A4P7XLJ9_9ALTE|nr:glyceraldehyde 3-phosphate dehydrogenase NAD-binding domain-containing protein [Hydrocarboniclastica marina]QCF26837.1 erythrose-4-phosphate dehydrogenase [Hydrocarboniclastica marina]